MYHKSGNFTKLNVGDLHKAQEFYEHSLSWRSSITNNEKIFFSPEGGTDFILNKTPGFTHFSEDFIDLYKVKLVYNVLSKQHVDDTLAKVKTKGANIIRHANNTIGDEYVGFFSDLYGHVWKVIWNKDYFREGL